VNKTAVAPLRKVSMEQRSQDAAAALLAAAQAVSRARELAERAGYGSMVSDCLQDAHESLKYAVDAVAGRI
jgi:hypothetical protein